MGSYSTLVSVDGTTISYRELGDGPGVVLVHGALQTARSFSRLAESLASSFRVYVPNRRGREGSGPFGPAYGMDREVEDLGALLDRTGARFVFGLSSGALISFCTARARPGIEKLALYEPPLGIDGVDPAAWVPRYRREIDRGRVAAAMVTALKGTGDVEPTTYLPRALLVPLVALGIRLDAANARGERTAMRDLVPTIRYDALLQHEASALLVPIPELPGDVLLMGGDRSHRSLRRVLDSVVRRMPRARRVQLAKSGHIAADDAGRPDEVAAALRAFFSVAPAPGRDAGV
jgi:pimeloyl-ACP methyl ester carboxylesterase